ncbi:MAG: metallophosphoesterase family protein [Atopobiaceae bacterium]|nr:metallophosphoesterase family protein [Atopobiaceae bacterium]
MSSPNPTLRVDIISDTHGYLSDELLAELTGADLVVHAGDICSSSDFETLTKKYRVKACLGNNDWGRDYGPEVKKIVRFKIGELRFMVTHYYESLDPLTCDVGICGHTHRPMIERHRSGALLINPGSASMPRTDLGPTIVRLMIEEGQLGEPEIIQLKEEEEQGSRWERWISPVFRR